MTLSVCVHTYVCGVCAWYLMFRFGIAVLHSEQTDISARATLIETLVSLVQRAPILFTSADTPALALVSWSSAGR